MSYNVGFTSTIQGNATVDFGLSASIPNTAQLTADLKNPDSSSATGFSGGSLTPLFNVKDLSASITLGAYSKPELSLGVSLVKIGTADVDISVKLPEIDLTLTAAYDQAGACSGSGSSSTTAVTVSSSYDIEVDLDIEASLGSLASYSKTYNLFSITEPIASQCFPIDIPGLQPAQTALPTAASTVALSSITTAPSHIYTASGAPTLAPIVNGSSYLIAPSGVSVSGILASGTGAVLSTQTGAAPYPISNSTFYNLPGLTGTASSGFLRPSGVFRA